MRKKRLFTILLFLLITSIIPAPKTEVMAYQNYIYTIPFTVHFWSKLNDHVILGSYLNFTIEDWGYTPAPFSGWKEDTIYLQIDKNPHFLKINDEYQIGYVNLTLTRVRRFYHFAYFKFDAELPFWRDGDTIKTRYYELTLLSTKYGIPKILIKERNYTIEEVEWKKVEFKIGNSETVYTGYKFDYKNLHGLILARVPIFYGYIEKGEHMNLYQFELIANDMFRKDEDGRLINYLNLTIIDHRTGKTYNKVIQEGKEVYMGDLIIKYDNAIYGRYAEITVKPKGALGYLYIDADDRFKLYEGQSMNLLNNLIVKNYLTLVDTEIPKELNYTTFYDPFEDRQTHFLVYGFADIGLKTPCQVYLVHAKLHDSPVAELLNYEGIFLAIDGTGEDKNGEYAEVIAFYEYPTLPEPYNASNLLVTFEVPEKVKQYQPFNATLIIKNTGETTLKYGHLEFHFEKGFELINTSLPCNGQCGLEIPAGKEVRVNLTMIATKWGTNKTVGYITVKAKVPYQVACYGLEEVEFTSNIPITTVEYAIPRLELQTTLTAENITEKQLFNITVNITNNGNIVQDITLTIEKPNEIVIINPDYMIDNHQTFRLEPNASKVFNITFIGLKAGNYTITFKAENMHKERRIKSVKIELKPIPTVITPPENITTTIPNETIITNQTNVTKPVENVTTPITPPENVTAPSNITTGGNITENITEKANITTTTPQKGNVTIERAKIERKSIWSNRKVQIAIISLILLAIILAYILKNYEIKFFYEVPEEEEEGKEKPPETGDIDIIPTEQPSIEEEQPKELKVEELLPSKEEYEKLRGLIPSIPIKIRKKTKEEKKKEKKRGIKLPFKKESKEKTETQEKPPQEEETQSETTEPKEITEEELPENPIDIDL